MTIYSQIISNLPIWIANPDLISTWMVSLIVLVVKGFMSGQLLVMHLMFIHSKSDIFTPSILIKQVSGPS